MGWAGTDRAVNSWAGERSSEPGRARGVYIASLYCGHEKWSTQTLVPYMTRKLCCHFYGHKKMGLFIHC